MTAFTLPAASVMGAVLTNRARLEPSLAVVTSSVTWGRPSSKVRITGQLGQGASRPL